MRYSFTFKGVSSDSFPWLIVSELPPITISPMRYENIVIDGKDGDELVALGRDSYNKNIFVGLARGYDIDALGEWLTGSGELVMSNEPTKKYLATITEQIDFDRLVCFRTGNINFHVQPFKYLVDEDEVNAKASGKVINLGNEPSKPTIKIEGSGTVEVKLEGVTQFAYTFPSGENSVIIDSESEDAYIVSNGVKILKNRNMSGEMILLKPGTNNISYSGSVSALKIKPNSRWK